jgi:arylsulfatase A-like enzyme
MQGKSLRPLLNGQPTPDWRASFLYEYFEYPAVHCVRMNRGIRTHEWKLIHFWQDPQSYELYNLKADPDETHNLASNPQYRGTFNELKDRLDQLRKETHDVDLPSTDPGPCEFGIAGGRARKS